jgi:hypothetical protein
MYVKPELLINNRLPDLYIESHNDDYVKINYDFSAWERVNLRRFVPVFNKVRINVTLTGTFSFFLTLHILSLLATGSARVWSTPHSRSQLSCL